MRQQEVAEYAAALTDGLRGLRVRLLLEPGRFLVAQAGALVARVLYRKRNGAKEFLITDAGMNDLIRPALYGAHHEIVAVERPPGNESQSGIMDVVDRYARRETSSRAIARCPMCSQAR